MNEKEIFNRLADKHKEESKKYIEWASEKNKNRAALSLISIESSDGDGKMVRIFGFGAGNAEQVSDLLQAHMIDDSAFEHAVLRAAGSFLEDKAEQGKLVDDDIALFFIIQLKSILNSCLSKL